MSGIREKTILIKHLDTFELKKRMRIKQFFKLMMMEVLFPLGA